MEDNLSTSSHGRLWPNRLWPPKKKGRLWCFSGLADFGQTNFGQTNFGQNRLWPKPTLAKTDFGQNRLWSKPTVVKTDFGQNPTLVKPTLVKSSLTRCGVLLCACFTVSWGRFTCGCWFQGFGLVMFGGPGPPFPGQAALGPPRLHTTAREPNRAHFRVLALKNTTKFQRKDHQERKERMKIMVGEGKKKARNFGRSGGRGSGGGGRPGSTHENLNSTTTTQHTNTPQHTTHTNTTHTQHKIGQKWIGQKRSQPAPPPPLPPVMSMTIDLP